MHLVLLVVLYECISTPKDGNVKSDTKFLVK